MRTKSIHDAVWQAADQLMTQGIRPTVANVREITQRGSAGTINDALKDWWQDLAKRMSVHSIHPDIPETVASVMQQLWQLALTEGEAAFEQFKQESVQKVAFADKARIAALERQQHLENQLSVVEARIETTQASERKLQTVLATEQALRAQVQQQATINQQSYEKAVGDLDTAKNQLEKELALLAAQYQHTEQQAAQHIQNLQNQLAQQQHDFNRQLMTHEHTLQACEDRAAQQTVQLLQTQTELRLLQQQLVACLAENADLKRASNKRDVLRAKLKRY